MSLFFSHTHSSVEAKEADVQKPWEGFGRSVRNINITQRLRICLGVNDPTDVVSQVGVGFLWNLPAENLSRLRLLFSTATKPLWWQLGDTCVGSSPPVLIKSVTTQDWSFKEKLSACCSHVHHSDISQFCAGRAASAENLPMPQRLRRTSPSNEGSASNLDTHDTGKWKSALSTCRILILHVKMSRLSLFLSLSEKQTTLSDTLRL